MFVSCAYITYIIFCSFFSFCVKWTGFQIWYFSFFTLLLFFSSFYIQASGTNVYVWTLYFECVVSSCFSVDVIVLNGKSYDAEVSDRSTLSTLQPEVQWLMTKNTFLCFCTDPETLPAAVVCQKCFPLWPRPSLKHGPELVWISHFFVSVCSHVVNMWLFSYFVLK